MASVPADYVKDAPVDYDGEIFACLGSPLKFAGVSIPPPSLAAWSMLEVLDSKIVKRSSELAVIDALRAAYILCAKRESMPHFREWIRDGWKTRELPEDPKEWHVWDQRAYLWSKDAHFDRSAIDLPALEQFMAISFSGFGMIPPSGGGGSPYLFGAESIGAIIASTGAVLGLPYDRVLWDVPMTIIGFVVASQAKSNGAKGVSRPKDKSDIELQLKLARERETAGILHPWQRDNPRFYRPSNEQMAARPEIDAEWRDCLRAQTAPIDETKTPDVTTEIPCPN